MESEGKERENEKGLENQDTGRKAQHKEKEQEAKAKETKILNCAFEIYERECELLSVRLYELHLS